MNTPISPNLIADDVVVSLDYTLTVEGKLVDASEENEPIEFIQGYQNIIPGLEKQLYGMAIGDSKEVVVAAKDGYGDLDKEAIMDVPRKEFPSDIELEVGLELALQQPDGQVLHAIVIEFNDQVVKLDFNHPLAGKELVFRVTVVGLRPASQEEIAHGHVHGEHGEDDFDEDDEDLDGEFDDEEDEEWEDDEEEEEAN
jgi:FKBP-type peptidyl-prolyl cis-trans isomerase SlyD